MSTDWDIEKRGMMQQIVILQREIDMMHSHFKEHPECREGVMKAFFAYHIPHFRTFPEAHNFTSSSRQSKCLWCGRTRELVRHDDLPPQCQNRPPVPEISDCLKKEEESAHALLQRATRDIPRLVKELGLSGQSLFTIHSTHGYDPDMVAQFFDLDQYMLESYKALVEMDRALSRGNQHKETITAKQ